MSEPPLNFDRLKSVGTFVRTLEIWSFVFAFAFRRVALELKFTYKGGFTEAKKLERTEKLANWLRLGLLRLGPTFIKIGQQFSTRVDVLSKPFIRELEKLQDRVPPSPPPWRSRSSPKSSASPSKTCMRTSRRRHWLRHPSARCTSRSSNPLANRSSSRCSALA